MRNYVPKMTAFEGSIQSEFIQAGVNAYFTPGNEREHWDNFVKREDIACMGISDPCDPDHSYFWGIFHAAYTIEGPSIAQFAYDNF